LATFGLPTRRSNGARVVQVGSILEVSPWVASGLRAERPDRAVNNLVKRVKRIGCGFRSFAHYRIRVLLYAGRPN
jgi:hypothetical protein